MGKVVHIRLRSDNVLNEWRPCPTLNDHIAISAVAEARLRGTVSESEMRLACPRERGIIWRFGTVHARRE